MNLDVSTSSPEVAEFARRMKVQRERNRVNAYAAMLSIANLVEVCRHRTGQGYKIRALLFSLWNGKPTSLIEILGLDYAIREDLLTVLRAFGCDEFFYDQIKAPFVAANLFEWFVEEGGSQ